MLKQEMRSLPSSISAALARGTNTYFTGRACVHGHVSYRYVLDRRCAACAKVKLQEYVAKNKKRIHERDAAKWSAVTAEQRVLVNARRRAYYEKTKERRREERRVHYAKTMLDPSKRAARRVYVNEKRKLQGPRKDTGSLVAKQKYKKTSRGRVVSAAADAKRHASKMQRTPAWLTPDDLWMMEQAYELAALRTKIFGFAWHVDHVIPLQGKTVSGLHVPTNLQVISGAENVSKANKWVAT